MESLVIVSNKDGCGSGFICNMDGAKWLVTNEHVTRGNTPFTARYMDGRVVQFEMQTVNSGKKAAKKGKSSKRGEKDVVLEVAFSLLFAEKL